MDLRHGESSVVIGFHVVISSRIFIFIYSHKTIIDSKFGKIIAAYN
jgi:hypothetical protein